MGLTETGRDSWLRVLAKYADTDVPDIADRLAVEQHLSNLLGQMWWSATIHAAEGAVASQMEMVMVEHLHGRGDDLAAAMLSAMTDLGATPGSRRAASRCLERICAADATAPPWHGQAIELVECIQFGDVYEDQIGYVAVFDGASGPHAVGINIDYCPLQTDMITALVVTQDVAWLRQHMAGIAEGSDTLIGPNPIDATVMASVVPPTMECVSVVDYGRDISELPQGLVQFRSLLLGRLRLLPEAEPWIPDQASERELADLTVGFFNDTDPLLSQHEPSVTAVWNMLNSFSFGGLRVSPMQVYILVNVYLPTKFDADEPVIAEIPKLLPRMCDWVGRRMGLDEPARKYLRVIVDVELNNFPEWHRRDPQCRFVPRPRAR